MPVIEQKTKPHKFEFQTFQCLRQPFEHEIFINQLSSAGFPPEREHCKLWQPGRERQESRMHLVLGTVNDSRWGSGTVLCYCL